MSRTRKLLSGLGLFIAMIAVAAILRSMQLSARQRLMATSAATGLGAVVEPEDEPAYLRAPVAAVRAILPKGTAGGVPGGASGALQRYDVKMDKSIIRTAELSLVVKNVPDALTQLRRLTLQQQGDVDESRQWSLSDRSREASLIVRVPSARLDLAIKEFESLALQITNERLVATDVTRQYTDHQARMRSLQAEEQQYLQILKQAKSVQDVLDVTEKLTDVRNSIEQLQTDINNMQHEIAMSSIAISVTQNEPQPTGFARWHPVLNAQRATRGMVESLGDWLDSVVSILIYLPVIILWLLTVGAIVAVFWKLLRFAWELKKRRSTAAPTLGPSPATLP